jgi:hypothetical protein
VSGTAQVELRSKPLVYGSSLELTHEASGARLHFNALDALKGWGRIRTALVSRRHPHGGRLASMISQTGE